MTISKLRIPLFVSVAARFVSHESRLVDGLRLAGVTLWLWARGRLGRPERAIRVAVTAPNGARAQLSLWTYIDVLVVREIFLDQDYRLPSALDVKTVLDLGSNSGVSVAFFRALFPEARIVAVEPDPTMLTRLPVNAGGTEIVAAAVAVETGVATFYAAQDAWYSSLYPPSDSSAEAVQIPTTTIDAILERYGVEQVDVLKMDIEGGEWPLLEAGHVQRSARCIVGELHGEELERRARAAFDGWSLDVRDHRGTVASFTAVR